jgi:hypothetical protein
LRDRLLREGEQAGGCFRQSSWFRHA